MKASTAPESPKQAAKRTISAQNICKIWVSERESFERSLGELKRNSETGLHGRSVGMDCSVHYSPENARRVEHLWRLGVAVTSQAEKRLERLGDERGRAGLNS